MRATAGATRPPTARWATSIQTDVQFAQIIRRGADAQRARPPANAFDEREVGHEVDEGLGMKDEGLGMKDGVAACSLSLRERVRVRAGEMAHSFSMPTSFACGNTCSLSAEWLGWFRMRSRRKPDAGYNGHRKMQIANIKSQIGRTD